MNQARLRHYKFFACSTVIWGQPTPIKNSYWCHRINVKKMLNSLQVFDAAAQYYSSSLPLTRWRVLVREGDLGKVRMPR